MTAGAAWFNGAFSKVAKAGQVAGTKTREKFHMAVSNLTAKVGFALHIIYAKQCYVYPPLILNQLCYFRDIF